MVSLSDGSHSPQALYAKFRLVLIPASQNCFFQLVLPYTEFFSFFKTRLLLSCLVFNPVLSESKFTTVDKPPLWVLTAAMLRSLFLLSLPASLHAYTTFNTTCSTLPGVVNYVSLADTRGTMDILWSCLFTIIACTWTVLHLNAPEQREGRDKN